jgi:hypothetical protein
MFAVHVPEAALRRIESFAGLEFDVCLRDASLPFVRDEPVAVVARRVSLLTDKGLGGASKVRWVGEVRAERRTLVEVRAERRTSGSRPGLTGKLCGLVSFCEPPLRLPLALACYESEGDPEDGIDALAKTRELCFVDLAAFPPQQFPLAGAGTDTLLRRAMTALLGGAWTPWPASPRTVVAAHTDIRGLRLYWVELPEAGSRAPARLLRVLCVDLDDIPFMADPVPLMADPEGRSVFVATQSLRIINCLQICARTGNVLASCGTEGMEPGQILPLAPDLWLHLSGEDTALLSATEVPRPQPAFWRALREGRPTTAACSEPGRMDLVPLRMSRGRLVLHDRRTGELLLCELRWDFRRPSLHFCGALEQALGGETQRWTPVSEGSEVEHLILRGAHNSSVVVHGDLRRAHGLVVRTRASLVVQPCLRSAHPTLAAVFDQARRQKERRVMAAAVAQGGPLSGSPAGSAANPIDLT